MARKPARQLPKPTRDQLRRLRGMQKSARTEANFQRWCALAKKLPEKSAGRPKADDDLTLPRLALLCEVAAREHGLDPTQAVRSLVSNFPEPAIKAFGQSRKAITARLLRKLKKPAQKRRARRYRAWLQSHGVDPKRLTTKAPH
jgi:hypothetical protein